MRACQVASIVSLCDPTDCSLPGCSVHGILQARILEWVAMPSYRDLPDSGIKPVSLMSLALAGECHLGSPHFLHRTFQFVILLFNCFVSFFPTRAQGSLLGLSPWFPQTIVPGTLVPLCKYLVKEWIQQSARWLCTRVNEQSYWHLKSCDSF